MNSEHEHEPSIPSPVVGDTVFVVPPPGETVRVASVTEVHANGKVVVVEYGGTERWKVGGWVFRSRKDAEAKYYATLDTFHAELEAIRDLVRERLTERVPCPVDWSRTNGNHALCFPENGYTNGCRSEGTIPLADTLSVVEGVERLAKELDGSRASNKRREGAIAVLDDCIGTDAAKISLLVAELRKIAAMAEEHAKRLDAEKAWNEQVFAELTKVARNTCGKIGEGGHSIDRVIVIDAHVRKVTAALAAAEKQRDELLAALQRTAFQCTIDGQTGTTYWRCRLCNGESHPRGEKIDVVHAVGCAAVVASIERGTGAEVPAATTTQREKGV